MRKSNQKGFTIIELLVVIVIIGILVALALPQLFAAQARGRDTERKNDLKNIKTQLETYYGDNGAYPTALTEASLNLTADDREGPELGQNHYDRPLVRSHLEFVQELARHVRHGRAADQTRDPPRHAFDPFRGRGAARAMEEDRPPARASGAQARGDR